MEQCGEKSKKKEKKAKLKEDNKEKIRYKRNKYIELA
jgi:hypothetical protein